MRPADADDDRLRFVCSIKGGGGGGTGSVKSGMSKGSAECKILHLVQ